MRLRGELCCRRQDNPFSLFWGTAKSSHLSLMLEFSNRYVRPDAAERALGWLVTHAIGLEPLVRPEVPALTFALDPSCQGPQSS